jgi:hypothetical protein
MRSRFTHFAKNGKTYPKGTGGLPPGVKWSGHEVDHSPPPSAEVKRAWSYTSTPTIRLHDVVLS